MQGDTFMGDLIASGFNAAADNFMGDLIASGTSAADAAPGFLS